MLPGDLIRFALHVEPNYRWTCMVTKDRMISPPYEDGIDEQMIFLGSMYVPGAGKQSKMARVLVRGRVMYAVIDDVEVLA